MSKKFGRGSWTGIDSRKLIITQRQGDGSYRLYIGFEVPEHFFQTGSVNLQDIEGTRGLLLSTEFYADWSEEYKDLIRHATDFRSWPLYYLPTETLSWKSFPGLTLAGDAAHVSIPNGQGVNLAMTDSLGLTTKIIEHGIENLDRAVQEYEADMITRGIKSITLGNIMAEALFREDHQPFVQMINSWFNPQ